MSAANLMTMLRRRLQPPCSDAELLRRYLADRSETAFRDIVARHGPMVLQLCRRRLGNTHSAEDAFQATFLTLSRKARSIRRPEALAAWLYGVAHRISCKARDVDHRRRLTEPRAA